MMRNRIDAALKNAMLAHDKLRTSTLRLMSAAIKNGDIAARGNGNEPVSDDDIAEILVKMIRQRHESARMFDKGNRPELAAQERGEIAIIEEFLPAQLDDAEMQSVCAEVIKATGAHGLRDMGKCMQALRARYAGQMDFGKASALVKGMLSTSTRTGVVESSAGCLTSGRLLP
jgi:uncharacterized protein YqeY